MDPLTAHANRDDAFLLDVREPREWQLGHIDGSVHVPMGELAARQDELPTDRLIIAVCRTGSRSGMVTRALEQAGYEVANLDGGLRAWVREGLELVADTGEQGLVA